jgi:hypothetical protein
MKTFMLATVFLAGLAMMLGAAGIGLYASMTPGFVLPEKAIGLLVIIGLVGIVMVGASVEAAFKEEKEKSKNAPAPVPPAPPANDPPDSKKKS